VPGKQVPTPRPWFKLDTDFLHQDTIRTLMAEFGHAAPLVVLEIFAEAKKADLAGLRPVGEQGTLSTRAAALASVLDVAPEAVQAIVSRAVELGLLAYLDGTNIDAGRLVVRSLKREAWEPRDGTAAARAARKRERDGAQGNEYEEQDPVPF
jgi:hypothetical protein